MRRYFHRRRDETFAGRPPRRSNAEKASSSRPFGEQAESVPPCGIGWICIANWCKSEATMPPEEGIRGTLKPILVTQFCGFWLGWGRPECRNSGVRTTQSVYDTGSNDLGGSLPLSATAENSRDGDRCTNAGNGTSLLPCSAAFWAGHEILRTAPDHGATLHPCPRR